MIYKVVETLDKVFGIERAKALFARNEVTRSGVRREIVLPENNSSRMDGKIPCAN